MKTTLRERLGPFVETVGYCVALSWKASKLYTSARLIGKVLIPISGIVTTLILKYVIDLLAGAWEPPSDKTSVLIALISLSVLIALLGVVLQKVVRYCESMHNDMLGNSISLSMMDKAINADLALFDNAEYYDKLMSVTRDSNVLTYILWNVLDCVSSLIAFIGAFVVLSGANALYGVLMVAAALPSALAAGRYTKWLYALSLEQIKGERQKAYVSQLATDKRYAQDIRLYGIGSWLKGRYSKLWAEMFGTRRRLNKKRSVLTGLLDFLPEIAIGLITVDVSLKVLGGLNSVGDYSLYTGLISQLWANLYAFINSAMTIYDDKLKVSNIKSIESFVSSEIKSGPEPISELRTIEFKNVCFCYPNTQKDVLINVSFKVSHKEKLAIVGVNGSGKSTIIKLLLRFYDVRSGSILINGADIKSYDITKLRACFSVYFQGAPNYGFTIRENITLADSGREGEDSQIEAALRECDFLELLNMSDKGLNAYLMRVFDEEGVELSGGLHQKLALARAFYRRHSVLVLDEPSSSLDPEAEHRVFETLKRLCDGKTAIFTSHRLSNITLCDRIVVIENGRVIEQGTALELLRQKNRFAELFEYQAEKYRMGPTCG